VEPLEDRCLLSAPTTVATLNSWLPLFPQVAAGEVSAPRNNPALVFLGDSIIALWGASGHGVADYGLDGAATQNVLWQVQAGQLAGTFPFVVVLGIGINNLNEGDTPAATAAGIVADVQAIHQAAPQATVVVMGILPTNPAQLLPVPPQAEIRQTNALVAQALAGDPRALFADLSGAIQQPDGSIAPLMLIDGVHPSPLGYVNLTFALLPYLEQGSFKSLNGLHAL
jgi:lysophospholipase L1-like esterase